MKKAWLVPLVGVAALGVAPMAEAQGFPTRALSYRTWLARAFDQCAPPNLTVVTAPSGLPAQGCYAVHSDPLAPPIGVNPTGMNMKTGRLRVTRFPAVGGGQGKVGLIMTGLQSGSRVKVRLTLRTTREGVTAGGKSNKLVTFQDVVADCGSGLGNCFVANPLGVLVGSQTLTACLAQNGLPTGLAKTNLEILGAEVINCDPPFGVVARPGIRN